MSQEQVQGQAEAAASEPPPAPEATTDNTPPPPTESAPPEETTHPAEPPPSTEQTPAPDAAPTAEAPPPSEIVAPHDAAPSAESAPHPETAPAAEEISKKETAPEMPTETQPPEVGKEVEKGEEKTDTIKLRKKSKKKSAVIVEKHDSWSDVGEIFSAESIPSVPQVSETKIKKEKGVRKSVLDDDYEEQLERDLEEESDDDSAGSAGSYVLQKELVIGEDFFAALGEIPDLSEISSDTVVSEEIVVTDKRRSTRTVDTDSGAFVDPLTGEIAESSDEETPDEAGPEEEAQGEEEESEEEPEDDDDLLQVAIEDDVALDAVVPEEDAFDTFLELQATGQAIVIEEIDWEKMARDEARRQLEAHTAEFLRALVNRVVDKCEYIDPSVILRQNLDKMKLIAELQSKLSKLGAEQKARMFLNRKTVEYFRRKRTLRPIMEDNPETVTADMEKLKTNLTHLDSLLGQEEATKIRSDLRIEELESQVFDLQQSSNDEISRLEELIRKTLLHESSDRLKTVVENILNKMTNLRNEISDVRFILIQRQHTMANLIKKLDKLENLGNGLRMRDFENLQAETQALGKKIEERNAELNKLRSRCNADLHIRAHMKEKQQMVRNIMEIQAGALEDLLDDKKWSRERLYNLKIDRGRVRNEINELSFQGGLIDKPPLMIDYDITVEKLDVLHVKVDQLRAKMKDLTNRIQVIESKCGARDSFW